MIRSRKFYTITLLYKALSVECIYCRIFNWSFFIGLCELSRKLHIIGCQNCETTSYLKSSKFFQDFDRVPGLHWELYSHNIQPLSHRKIELKHDNVIHSFDEM